MDIIQILLNSTNKSTRKVLPILVYSDILSEALAKAKNLGYITINISSIFGERVLDILNELKVLRNSDLIDSNQSEFIDKIDLVIQSIVETGQEGNLSNIIGDLFESLILHLLKDIYSSASITANKFLPNKLKISTTKEFEYDFIIDVGFEETIVVEVKGYNHNNIIPYGEHDKKNTIKWFLNHTFLSAKKTLEKRSENPIKACYITTAKFSDETIDELEVLNKGRLKPSKMDLFYDGKKLLDLLETSGNKELKRVIKKHYFK